MKWENHFKNTRNGTWFIVTFSFSVGASAPAPALPPRRAPKCSGYENLPSKGAQPLPSREPPCEGYINIPARPDVCTSNGPPPLPPKAPSQGLQGYENLPTKNASSLRTRNVPYQNIGANGMMFTILSSVDPLVNCVNTRDTVSRRKVYAGQERQHLLKELSLRSNHISDWRWISLAHSGHWRQKQSKRLQKHL